MLDTETRRQLLALARRSVESAAGKSAPPSCEGVAGVDAPFFGVFVTLRKRAQLRGCIGTFSPSGKLPETVAEYARHSAVHDTRFPPVLSSEVNDLTIEISVLSPLEKTDKPASLEVGRHGIYLKTKGLGAGATACFLPQVAVEQKWDAEQFLSALCVHKCRPPLPPDAWQDPSKTEIYLFTAEVFGEGE
ncbi:MAG: AmmeMemoRadiSam system protein A [Phycisphaerae bacterium]|nr:AmmeMemoRadiSam system protein A [Phycisphaerae bacterium]